MWLSVSGNKLFTVACLWVFYDMFGITGCHNLLYKYVRLWIQDGKQLNGRSLDILRGIAQENLLLHTAKW